jgi:hypothetical protein
VIIQYQPVTPADIAAIIGQKPSSPSEAKPPAAKL